MEFPEITFERLREKLGRDPTDAELKAERDRLWRINLADRMLTDLAFRDEIEPTDDRDQIF
jgi:hypothetical protein